MSLDALRKIFQEDPWDSVFPSLSSETEITTAWYPSSGSDWGAWLSMLKRNIKEPAYREPNLFIFNDYDRWDRSHSGPFTQGSIFYINGEHFDITSIINLTFQPNIDRGNYPGRGGTPLLKSSTLYSIKSHGAGAVAHVIFIEGDNLQVMKELYLGDPLLRITHLMWTCDGWTEGMSRNFRRPGNFLFIKELLGSLGTSWVFTEENYAATSADYWPDDDAGNWHDLKEEPNLNRIEEVRRWIDHNSPQPIFLYSTSGTSYSRHALQRKVEKVREMKTQKEKMMHSFIDEIADHIASDP